MSKNNRKLTKATRVEKWLRDDIACGKILPGEKLQMDALKDRYGVGYSPLREALSRLTSNGLVRQEEQCGFCVAPLSLEELHDLYQVRSYIENLALELALRHGDAQWEAEIVASWHVFSKYLDPASSNEIVQEEWERLQKIFLNALVKGCNSPWLLKIRDMLYDQASRYRGICIKNHTNNKDLMYAYIKENQELVDAVLGRDLEKVIRISETGWKYSVNAIAQALAAKLVK